MNIRFDPLDWSRFRLKIDDVPRGVYSWDNLRTFIKEDMKYEGEDHCWFPPNHGVLTRRDYREVLRQGLAEIMIGGS